MAIGLLLLHSGCASRGLDRLNSVPESKADMWLPVQRPAAEVDEVIPLAAKEMGLLVKSPAQGDAPWVLFRRAHMNNGRLYFRVEVEEIPGEPQWSKVAIYSAYLGGGTLLQSSETLSRPGELGYRIVTLALTKQPSVSTP